MSICDVPNCQDEVVSHGLCDRHRKRLKRHGNVNAGRPNGWGSKSKHQLWQAYKSLLRTARRNGGYDPKWDDFHAFLADVGERPSDKHRIYRINQKAPFEKGNMVWRQTVADKSTLESSADYQRAYRMKRPHITRNHHLRRHFGITIETYNEMFEAQDGLCAICGQPEKNKHAVTGEPTMLAVDHDHKTGAVRGLLCADHNRALGMFQDRVDLLRSAIAYLDHHAR